MGTDSGREGLGAGRSAGSGAERRDLYQRIVETTSEGVWAVDAENRTRLVNASLARMIGYSPEEMLGRSMFDFMDGEGARSATRHLERRRSGIAETHELVFLRRTGERVVTRLTTDPI